VVQLKADSIKAFAKRAWEVADEDVMNFHGSTLGCLIFSQVFSEERTVLTIHDSRAKLTEFLNLRPSHWKEVVRLIKHPNFRARLIPLSIIKRIFDRWHITSADLSWLNKVNGHEIKMGVDTKRFSSGDGERIRDELGMDGKVIMYMGHGYMSRGVDDLVRVHKFFKNAILLLVLNPKYPTTHIVKMLEKLPPQTYRVVNEFVDRPEDYYSASDVVVLPYRYGGELPPYPFVLLEAMASGRNVITTPVNAIPKLIKDGENGLLVKPSKPDMLRKAISSALSLSLGEGARKSVDEFDWNIVARKMKEVYEEVENA
jgi:glycosyltransferase involved in cell wall biosynthesis